MSTPRHDCKTDDRKLAIDRPCSACSAGDSEMEYHDHCPPFREGVAAPLEPTQIAARKFRIEKGINDGTMMSGTWIDEVVAEFAGAVGRKLQEDISAADQAACTWIADAEFWRKEYESAAAVSKNLQEELAHAVSCMDRSCKRCNKVQLEIAALRETK